MAQHWEGNQTSEWMMTKIYDAIQFTWPQWLSSQIEPGLVNINEFQIQILFYINNYHSWNYYD